MEQQPEDQAKPEVLEQVDDREKLDVVVMDTLLESNDIIVELSLWRADLEAGKKGKFAIKRREACEACEAKGCGECEGGSKNVDAFVDIDVPAGAAAGMQIRVPTQGHLRAGKPQGDVIVVIGAKSGDGGSPAASIAKSPATMVLYLVMVGVVIVILFMFAR